MAALGLAQRFPRATSLCALPGPTGSTHSTQKAKILGKDPPRAASHAGDGRVGMGHRSCAGTGRGCLGLWSGPVSPIPGLFCPQDPSSWAPHATRFPDLGCHSLTLEEAFSCTRTSASFTSNKASCTGDEGEEAQISRALSSVFNQTLTRDYTNAELMKHSQPQLFQVFSLLPFFPTTQCFHTSIFSQTTPRGSNNSDLSPKAPLESSIAFPEFSKCFPACSCIFSLMPFPILAAEMLLT